MRLKIIVKKTAKFFVALKQENERIIGQSVLIVDNGYGWIGYMESGIEKVRNYFPKAEITVLTNSERKSNLEKDFPGLKFILPFQRLKPKRYRIALQMLKMRRVKHDFIILLSLDITPLIVSLLFSKSRVVLYNQWGQWWPLRLRNIGEFFKATYSKKKTRRSLKALLRKLGLFFILIQRRDEESLRHSVLVVDNGGISIEHINTAIVRIKKCLPRARVSLLTPVTRRELRDRFNDLEIIQAANRMIKRLTVTRQMLALRKKGYDYIILLSLDAAPICAAMLFMKGRVLLFNRWQQWWSLKLKAAKNYLAVVPRAIINIILFIYLVISVSWIFLKRACNALKFSLFDKRG